MKNGERDKVIDFSREKTKRAFQRRRRIWITVSCTAAVLLLVGVILFIQLREVTDRDKGFWHNFQPSSQSSAQQNTNK